MTSKILAIDIGGTHTKLALVDASGKTDDVVSIQTSGEDSGRSFLQLIEESALELIAKSGDDVPGCGTGVAGFIDPSHSKMIFNPNIPWLEGIELKDHFSKKLHMPVVIEIDSNAAALAEAIHGGGKNSKRLLVLAVGTGLGGGMIVDGKILRIANECLGDIGHVLVEPGGFACASGCRGCAEAMVSVSALERYASDFFTDDSESVFYEMVNKGKIIQPAEIIKAAKQGDQAAERAIQKLGMYLGIALASMAPVFAPDQISIAGGISESGPILIDAIKDSFLKYVGPPYAKGVTIQKATLGWQSVLVGAAEAFRRS
jgi:glucokinase